MANWTPIPTHVELQLYPQIINELLESFYARGFYSRTPPIYYGVDEGLRKIINRHSLWAEMQGHVMGHENEFSVWFEPTEMLNHYFRYDTFIDGFSESLEHYADSYTFPEYFPVTLFEDAGIPLGFRRAVAWDPTISDWTDYEDPMFEYGMIQEYDILGPWIIEDLRKILGPLIHSTVILHPFVNIFLANRWLASDESSWADALANLVKSAVTASDVPEQITITEKFSTYDIFATSQEVTYSLADYANHVLMALPVNTSVVWTPMFKGSPNGTFDSNGFLVVNGKYKTQSSGISIVDNITFKMGDADNVPSMVEPMSNGTFERGWGAGNGYLVMTISPPYI